MSKICSIFMFMTLILIGCAPKAPSSNVKVSMAAMLQTSAFPGGLVLSGKNLKGQSFSKIISATDTIEMELPNGTWTFAAVGWKESPVGVSGALEGEMHCDLLVGQNLIGDDVDLVFETSMAKCASNANFGGKFNVDSDAYTLEFNTCLDIQREIIKGGATAAPVDLICGASGQSYSGGARSVKISLQTTNIDGSSAGSLPSSCISFGGSYGTQATSEIKLPYSESLPGIKYRIETYSDNICTTSAGVYMFERGFRYPAREDIGSVTPDDGLSRLRVFLHASACGTDIANSSSNPVELSTGVYQVCKKEQFEAIGSGAAGSFDSSATYIIGKNIVFGGSNITISGDFSGKIIGNGYVLSGGDKALFQKIINPADAAKTTRLENFKISDFAYSTSSSGISLGILAQEVVTGSYENRIEFSDITIDASSSITNTSPDSFSETHVGALIGKVESANNLPQIGFRNIKSYANVMNNSRHVTSGTGGLVGKVTGVNTNPVSFKNIKVGVNPENLQDTSMRVYVEGYKNVGGAVGSLSNANVEEGSRFITKLDGEYYVGGIAGVTSGSVNVKDSAINLEIAPTQPMMSVGGVIGRNTSTEFVNVSGVNADFSAVDFSSTHVLTNVGGILGEHLAPDKSFSVNNARVYADLKVSGSNHGGFVGDYNASISGAGSIVTIQNSTVRGYLEEDASPSNSIGNRTKGGFAGRAINMVVKRSIADNINIQGATELGGAYGFAEGPETRISEAEINVSIINTQPGTDTENLYTGGIIGRNDIIDTGVDKYQSIRVRGQINLASEVSGTDCATGSYCGKLLGSNLASNDIMNGIASDITFKDVSNDYLTDVCGGGNNCILNTNFSAIYDGITNQGACESGLAAAGYAFTYEGGNCHLAFELAWKNSGFTSTYLAGNSLEPFPINTIDDWNKIRDDALLMDKSFELKADLDFQESITFRSVGSLANPFRGSLISNGYGLSNIFIDALGQTSRGVFNKTEGARISTGKNNQLVINGLEVRCTTRCGFIGEARETSMSVVVNNGRIISDAAGNTVNGGLVGIVIGAGPGSRTEIYKSGFSGSLENNTVILGGLVGQLSSSELVIDQSFAKLDFIQAQSNGFVGGFVGVVQNGSGTKLTVRDSYVVIDPMDSHVGPIFDNANYIGGLVGSLKNSGELHTIQNSFVDILGEEVGSNFRGIAAVEPTVGGVFDGGSSFVVGGAATPPTPSGVAGAIHETHSNYEDLVGLSSSFELGENYIFNGGKVKLWWE